MLISNKIMLVSAYALWQYEALITTKRCWSDINYVKLKIFQQYYANVFLTFHAHVTNRSALSHHLSFKIG